MPGRYELPLHAAAAFRKMTPIVLVPFVKDLLLGSRIEALASQGFQIQKPDWGNPAGGIDPERSVIIVDCNLPSPDPKGVISACRALYPRIPILGFVSHVDAQSKRQAEEAGADAVYPRSQFFGQTAEMIQRHFAVKTGEGRDDSV